jgi:hypothetical protein
MPQEAGGSALFMNLSLTESAHVADLIAVVQESIHATRS